MSLLLDETGRIDEPSEARHYSEVLTEVAASKQPIIVRRGGEDLAAVVPLEHLELLMIFSGRCLKARKTICCVNYCFLGKQRKWPLKSTGIGLRKQAHHPKSGLTATSRNP